MSEAIDLIRHSVTRNDHADAAPGAWNIMVGSLTAFSATPGLPPYWSRERDLVLTATREMEDMWSASVYKAKTKTVALGWEVSDSQESQTRVRRAQQLLLHFDGKRYVPGFSKVLDDFLLTDNGAFVEIVRATQGAGSRILGLMHLDSLRCWRTGDPKYPVLYRDRHGKEHILKPHQVLDFVDEPSPRAEHRGVGRCAASRAFRTILKLTGVETYFREKITGERNLAIHIVNGITSEQLQSALLTGREDAQRRGFVLYRGSLVIPAIKMDADLQVVTIPLAEVPDGFDVTEERRDAYLRYANALGVPVQDIQPLSGQGLGTGTQTVILAEESEGMGLAAFRDDWKHALNEYVFPESTTFAWNNTHDLRDQRAMAETEKIRAETRSTQINSGEISPAMARQLAVDAGDLPRELVADRTTGGVLGDSDKPVDEAVDPRLAATFPLPTTVQAGPRGGALKEYKYNRDWTPQLNAAVRAGALTEAQADELMYGTHKSTDDDLAAARKLYEEILGDAEGA